MADFFFQAYRSGIPRRARTLELQHQLVNHLQNVWQNPDHGIWEERGKPQHFVYSKVMAWVTMDRGIHSVESHLIKLDAAQLEQWRATRQKIHDQVQTLNTQRGARTMALDPETGTIYLVTAGFSPAPAATAVYPHPRPAMLPNSFVVLVVGKK